MIREPSRGLLVTLVIAAIAVFLWQGQMGAPLRNPQAPHGGISLQLAYTRSHAQGVIDSWREPVDQRGLALRLQWLDYLFILLYASSINLLGRRLARGASGWIAFSGRLAAKAGVVAGLLDAIENGAMISMLSARATELAARTATLCSIGKFSLLAIAFALLLTAFVARILSRHSGV